MEEEIYSEKIEEACKNIAEYVHPKYLMINCIKHGIIYHGSIAILNKKVNKISIQMPSINYI